MGRVPRQHGPGAGGCSGQLGRRTQRGEQEIRNNTVGWRREMGRRRMKRRARGAGERVGGAAFAYPGVSRRARAVVGGDGKGGGGWLQARKRCCRE